MSNADSRQAVSAMFTSTGLLLAVTTFTGLAVCRWDVAWYYLAREKQLDSCPPTEAAKRVGGGQWVLVDIRPKHKYEQSHAEGAVNVQYYKRARRLCCPAFLFTQWHESDALTVALRAPWQLRR